MTGGNLFIKFLINSLLRHAQRQGIAGQFFELAACAVIDHRRVVSGVDPVEYQIAAVDFTDKQRHETTGIFDIQSQLAVYVRNHLIQLTGSGGALTQERPRRGHEQRRRDTVIGDVADHHADLFLTVLAAHQIIVIISAGLFTINAGAGNVQAFNVGVFSGE